jgi:hypothetical protein
MASRSELTLCAALFLLSCPAPIFADKLQITSNLSGATVGLDGVAVGATLSKRNSRATPTGAALSKFSSPAKSPSRPLSNQDPEVLFPCESLPSCRQSYGLCAKPSLTCCVKRNVLW